MAYLSCRSQLLYPLSYRRSVSHLCGLHLVQRLPSTRACRRIGVAPRERTSPAVAVKTTLMIVVHLLELTLTIASSAASASTHSFSFETSQRGLGAALELPLTVDAAALWEHDVVAGTRKVLDARPG